MRIFRAKIITMIDSESTETEQVANEKVWEIPAVGLSAFIWLLNKLEKNELGPLIDIMTNKTNIDLTFKKLQDEHKPWNERNFPGHEDYFLLLGVMEELGELAHSHLKNLVGIKGTPKEHQDNKIDAIGDIVIFLAEYCNASGIDFQSAVQNTWDKVRSRDYNKMREENNNE